MDKSKLEANIDRLIIHCMIKEGERKNHELYLALRNLPEKDFDNIVAEKQPHETYEEAEADSLFRSMVASPNMEEVCNKSFCYSKASPMNDTYIDDEEEFVEKIVSSRQHRLWIVFMLLAAAVAVLIALAFAVPKMHRDRESTCMGALHDMERNAPEVVLAEHFINISAEEAAKLLPGIKEDYLCSPEDGVKRYEAGMTLVALYLRLGRNADAERLLSDLLLTNPDSTTIRSLLEMLSAGH